MKKLSFAFLLLLGVSIFPEAGYAYQAVETHAVKLSENTLMFTITSRFSYMNYGLQLPLLAKRNDVAQATYPYAGYALYTEDGDVYTKGQTSAAVLSDAKLTKLGYVAPKNEAEHFTLLVLLTLPEGTDSGTGIYLKTTTQPFGLIKDGVITPSQLDRGQLQTHKTPVIKL